MPRRLAPVAALLAASVLVLAGCAAGAQPGVTADGRLQVVASTNVYGDIAAAVGGSAVSVTSLIDSASQDPHEFEASAKDQLLVQRADVLIENGGGYDPFVDALAQAAGATSPVITAAELSPAYPADGDLEGFNEHVFYDVAVMAEVADAIATALGALDPAHASTFTANAKAFADGTGELEAALAQIKSTHGGAGVFVTEPVPLYLTAAAGLVNKTPDAFSEAVEEGQDVPPATLLDALRLISGGDVDLVITNAQAAGAETTQVEDKAADAGIPVLKFSELVPEGKTYLTWMRSNIDALAQALA